tara:strand:- start:847 stop:1233 length:387 start_codon:yes stop_codon:yes gene_type:complete
MKVKLSYTVDEEEVLQEVSQVLSNQGPTIQEFINGFNGLVESLLEKEDKLNIAVFRDSIHNGRQILAKIDLRLEEVDQMVNGYNDYLESQRVEDADASLWEPRDFGDLNVENVANQLELPEGVEEENE